MTENCQSTGRFEGREKGLRRCHVAPPPTEQHNRIQSSLVCGLLFQTLYQLLFLSYNYINPRAHLLLSLLNLMLSLILSLHILRLNSRVFILNPLQIGDLGGERCKMGQPSENRTEGSSDFNASDGSKRFADEILPHILSLYTSRATSQDFEIYAPNATFEDPLMCAHGVKQIKSSFYSLKVFSESRIVEYDIKENVLSPGKHEILIDNKQYYKFMERGIDMVSLIKLDVEGGKVMRHEDRWDKKPLLNRETAKLPLVGRSVETARRGSMFVTHLLMGFGKDPMP